jgi:tetratricopeptide (TPR) repeat protein
MPQADCLRVVFGVCLILSWNLASAQGTGGGRPGGAVVTPGGVRPEVDPALLPPIFVTGNVILDGGAVPPEPIAIQRVCGGALHREGYTDAKGQFQFELGRKLEQDSSENDSLSGSGQQMKTYGPTNQPRYEGCDLRASLAGYQSTSVPIRMDENFGQLKVGTIVLTRMQNVQGATISMTSLKAPKEARQAYDRGRKAQSDKKFPEAEKELNKAVQLYPEYAAAWYLLGEIHRAQRQQDQAIKEYTQSTTCDPQYVSPYFGLAVIAIDQKRWQDAQRITDQINHLNSFAYPLAYFYNSAASFNLGQIDVAEQSARKFESIDAGHHTPEIFRLLAMILEAKRDYAGAAQELRSYLAIVPALPHAAEAKTDLQRLESMATSQQK